MKGSKLLKNEYVFSILSRFASVALSLLQSVLVARYLGKALQGVSAYITSITIDTPNLCFHFAPVQSRLDLEYVC